jgi:Thiol-activated cytolysin
MRTLTFALLLCSVATAALLVSCSDTTNNNFGFALPPTVGEAGAENGEAGATGAAGNAGELTDAGTTEPTDASAVSSAVSKYLSDLPGWPAPDPDSNEPVAGADAGAPNYVTGTDGIEYACTTSEWSLTSTPTQIVTFNPNVDVLWPGALLQGKPYRDGELIGLPITQRAPIVVSIPTLLAAHNSQLVPNPTVASTEDAVGSLISSAIDAGVEASSSVSYTQTEAHSTSQVSLALGFSADFVGGSLSGQLNLSESAELNTVVGYFVQSMFTVTVPEPEQPSDLFNGLSQTTIDQLSAQGAIGKDNRSTSRASSTAAS